MNALQRFVQARERLFAELPRAPSGLAWCRAYSDLVDAFVRAVAARALAEMADSVALLATGGYGRREMAPHSDVDLLVVPSADADPALDEAIRTLHRALHDAFEKSGGPTFSYAFFLQNDAEALDFKTRTALLDARRVFGSAAAARAFIETARQSLPVGEFLMDKLIERQALYAKWNDTPLAAEPNLKDGAGGLRCFQAANWIRAAMGQRPLPPDDAYEHILRIRNLLHVCAGRNQDRWTRQRQAEVAERLGVDVHTLVAETLARAERLARRWQEAAELISRARFSLSTNVRAESGQVLPKPEASLSGAAAGVALATGLLLRVQAPFPTSDELDGPDALWAIGTGEATLRNLDRAGLLTRLIPELEPCRTLVPDDAVHAYSVLEHSLRTVRNVEQFPSDSFYGKLRDGLSDRSVLIFAALLHDVGKAFPGRPHSEAGANIVADLAVRWNLAPGVSRVAEWLVRQHLTMARFIGMRDVSDPKAVAEFAALVEDRERLDMLTILTCADVSAVGPNTWTPAQNAFTQELHGRTAALLESDGAPAADAETMRRRVVRSLKDHPVEEAALQAFLDRMPAQYAVHTAPELVPVHMGLAEKARRGESSAVWDHDREKRLSEITVCAADRPGLLTQILGVLYAFDLSVYGLRANTSNDPPGQAVALDTVLTAFGHQNAPPATCGLVQGALSKVIGGEIDLFDLLIRQGKDPNRKQDNFRFAFVEGSPGILEFQAPQGRGMAFRLSRMIWDQGWDIVAARFGQWAGKGAAAFYVLGPGGRRLTKDEVDRALSNPS